MTLPWGESIANFAGRFVLLGIGVLLIAAWFADFIPGSSKDETGQSVEVSIAAELGKYALLPFEDGQLSQPSTAAVFIEPDGVLLAFEADFGPPENFRTAVMQFSFGPRDIGEIRLEGKELLFVCRGGEKCIKKERRTELSMPIERSIGDAPLRLKRFAISFRPVTASRQRWIRGAFVQRFESIGIKLAR